LTASAREVALEAIRRVVEDGAYSNLVLSAELRRSSLSRRDRALATELTYGTLRRRLPIDHALTPHLRRGLEATPQSVLEILRLGAYQLLYTRIPSYAAISSTVDLASGRQRGFVNAVLRRVERSGVVLPSGDSDDDVSIRTGLAPWAVRELGRHLGDAEAESAAAAFAEPAPLTVRVNACVARDDEVLAAFEAAGVQVMSGRLRPSSLVVSGAVAFSSPRDLPGFREGAVAIQDQASAFVVDVLDPRPGERVLDACAAPGGKSADIGCRVADGGRLVAADVSPVRARLVLEQLRRLHVPGVVVAQDTRRPAVRGRFDRVLVDAPCSGIGSARRRPELLWRVTRDRLASLARLQVAIAEAAADLLRPGGRLVYSVCTFPRAETDAACDALVRHRPDLVPEPIEGPDGRSERVRLWPHRHGSDGMFVASFRKVGEGRR
jgi:16S rRNA (cytosine967-C5)-methyltransferase